MPGSLCGVCNFPPCLSGFSEFRYSDFLSHLKGVHTRLIVVRVCMRVMRSAMDRRPVHFGFCLCPGLDFGLLETLNWNKPIGKMNE